MTGTAPTALASPSPLDLWRIEADRCWAAGDLAGADAFAVRMLAADPGAAHAAHLRGLVAHARGDAGGALAWIWRACAAPAAPALFWRNLAQILQQAGRTPEALSAAQEAVGRDPGLVEGWLIQGLLLAETGQAEAAIASLERAVGLDPGNPEARNNLAVLLHRQGRPAEAELHYRAALAHDPDHPPTLTNLAALIGDRGDPRAAYALVERAIALAPDHMLARLVASELATDLGRPTVALDHAERATAAAPGLAAAHLGLARARWRLDQPAMALAACDEALARDPDLIEALELRALILQALGQTDAALAAHRTAEAIAPDPTPIIANRARLLMETGALAEARRLLEEVVATAPRCTLAWYNLAYLKRFDPDDPALSAMTALLDDPALPMRERLCLNFALGKAYLDGGDGARAFQYLDAGNALKRGMIDYDADATDAWFDRIIAAFPPERFARRPPPSPAGPAPILVLGMPRSGTTLLEQILASHPQVHGGGEPMHLAVIAELAADGPTGSVPFPDSIEHLSPIELERRGALYWRDLARDAGDRPFVVDKAPRNFPYAGLAALMLPGARFIHCRRRALDSCLSAYSLLFTQGQEFSYDQTDLGRYYRGYHRVMAHWRRVLPPDRFIEVDYEALVADLAGETRRLLDFCRLPWHEGCLQFHETNRMVTSASFNQVRQPLYRGSLGRAETYRPWLRPLIAALGDLDHP